MAVVASGSDAVSSVRTAMPRFFNTAGPCNPADHYMLPPERRLPAVRDLIERALYFSVHAPRQSGKTTCFEALAQSLTSQGSYVALLAGPRRAGR